MADRFPLIVNPITKKIEELVGGDNLDLTGNNIVIEGVPGAANEYLRSNGTSVEWGNPGDVYLTGVQIISDKVFTNCTLSGSENTISNLPNTSLANSSITINGVSIPLGGSVTTTDTNTTYSISAVDGTTETRKSVRLTSGGSGTVTNQDVTFVAGTNVSLSRSGSDIIISSQFTDTDTITTLRSQVGGTATSGDIVIAGDGSTTVAQNGNTITVTSTDTDTITRLRSGIGSTFLAGDFTFLSGGATTVSQTNRDITISSVDTITRLRGGSGTFTSGDISITGGGSTVVTQAGSTITVTSTDTNTVTRLRGTTGGVYESGDVTILGSGSTTISQNGKEITITSTDTNTTYGGDPNGGVFLSGTDFSLKNYPNFTDQTVLKWDNSNKQFTNSLITDDGSVVTIGGDLRVTGTTTTINSQTLVVADNTIELRRGSNLLGANGGIQLNRITNSSGTVTAFTSLEWFESGGFWRTWDGSNARRLVTETETQTLTNKTLTSPVLTTPTLGNASASSINGLQITNTVSASLTLANSKNLTVNNSVTFNTAQNDSAITVQLSNGGTVAYTSNTLAVFASTTSAQLRGVISDSTGVGFAVFNQNPSFNTSITTSNPTFSVFNTGVTTINAFGAATSVNIGAATGTTTINNDLSVAKSVTLGTVIGDIIKVNGSANFENEDITIRGGSGTAIKIGRGRNAIASNTRLGYNCLDSIITGFNNTSFGYESGFILNDGYDNTSFGYRALRTAGTGYENVAVGSQAGVSITQGNNNVCVGTLSLSSATTGSNNVCIGTYAGAVLTGSGNVLIGPADTKDSTSATYAPPAPGGDRQLIIGSGVGTWIRGDNGFNVTTPNNLVVGGNAQINGDLTVNGTTTTLNARNITIDDKAIELGAVADINFLGNVQVGSSTISNVSSTAGLIVGMEVIVLNAGITLPSGTKILSIGTNSIVLDGNISGSSGSGVTLSAKGPSDFSANGGGLILRGTTNKTILYDNTQAVKCWSFSESVNVPANGRYSIDNNLILNTTTLGSSVVNSSLQSVGTLTSLSVSGSMNLRGRIVERVVNNYGTVLAPVANELTISAQNGNTIVGTLNTDAINVWSFTNLGLTNGSSITITLILQSNPSTFYGDECKVEGASIATGIRWSGGAPPSPTGNADILTFIIVQDNAGAIRVYGQGNTDFS